MADNSGGMMLDFDDGLILLSNPFKAAEKNEEGKIISPEVKANTYKI
jgi:hypothetical protein